MRRYAVGVVCNTQLTLRKREHIEAAAEFDAAIGWYAERRTLLAAEFLDAVVE